MLQTEFILIRQTLIIRSELFQINIAFLLSFRTLAARNFNTVSELYKTIICIGILMSIFMAFMFTQQRELSHAKYKYKYVIFIQINWSRCLQDRLNYMLGGNENIIWVWDRAYTLKKMNINLQKSGIHEKQINDGQGLKTTRVSGGCVRVQVLCQWGLGYSWWFYAREKKYTLLKQ